MGVAKEKMEGLLFFIGLSFGHRDHREKPVIAIRTFQVEHGKLPLIHHDLIVLLRQPGHTLVDDGGSWQLVFRFFDLVNVPGNLFVSFYCR